MPSWRLSPSKSPARHRLALTLLLSGLTFSACDGGAPSDQAGSTAGLTAGRSEGQVVTAGVVDPSKVGSGLAGDPATSARMRLSTPATVTNEQLAQVSKAIAATLADPEARSYVHSLASLRFDGDTNVLWSTLQNATGSDAPAAFGKTRGSAFSSALTQTAGRALGAGLQSSTDVDKVVASASEALGGPMHLLWMNADKVGPEQAPLVTFTPVGMDPDAIEKIVAYDAEGQEYVVDDAVAMQRPVVALSYNERVTEAQARAYDPSQPGTAPYKPTAPCNGIDPSRGGCDGGGGTGTGGTGTGGTGTGGTADGRFPAGHQAGNQEGFISGQLRLDYVKLYHDYEGFTMGGPELRLVVTSYNAASQTTDASAYFDIWNSHYIDDDWCDGTPIKIGKDLMPWNTTNNPTLSMKWSEVDGSIPQIPTELINATFKLPAWAQGALAVADYYVKKANEDESLGKADVNFEADLQMYYGLGNPDFHVSRNP